MCRGTSGISCGVLQFQQSGGGGAVLLCQRTQAQSLGGKIKGTCHGLLRSGKELLLRQILITENMGDMGGESDADSALLAETMKYATIIVATVPILILYPFLQKYFVKGVMVGSLKG